MVSQSRFALCTLALASMTLTTLAGLTPEDKRTLPDTRSSLSQRQTHHFHRPPLPRPQLRTDQHNANEKCSMFPENNLSFPIKFVGPLSDLQRRSFEYTLEQFRLTFLPLFNRQGKSLEIINEWDNPKVNAYATRDMEDNGQIIITGGMARHPMMTQDALVLVLCHELGHFFGGAPKALRGNTQKPSWSSAEGQADYFASSKCFKQLLEDKSLQWMHSSAVAINEDVPSQTPCQSQECNRLVQASLDLTKVFASAFSDLSPPQVERKDSTKVSKTLYHHPSLQCRLDTLLAGTYCQASSRTPFSDSDAQEGACVSSDSTHPSPGARPRCWYMPPNE